MQPTLAYPPDWELSAAVCAMLQHIFSDYSKVSLRREFSEGQSGTQVFLAVPELTNGEVELPLIVKIGQRELIEQEWIATRYATRKLPGFIEISGEPSYLTGAQTGSEPYGGLRYEMAGQGLFAIESLRAYSRQATASDLSQLLEERLLPQLRQLWQSAASRELRKVHASYDRVLPVNLLLTTELTAADSSAAADVVLNASQLQVDASYLTALPNAALVSLEGFIVTEIERAQHTVTLNLPSTGALRQASFRLRLQAVTNLDAYQLGAIAPPLNARLRSTRQTLLTAAAQSVFGNNLDITAPTLSLAGQPQIRLPNPLQAWPALLGQQFAMKIGTVHGDLNMGNVLVDPQSRTAQIIDCAHARRDHALYDLLRLEVEILLHPLAAALFRAAQPATLIYELYHWLDQLSHTEQHARGQFALPKKLQHQLPDLVTPLLLLTIIRNAARDYLATRDDWREYYHGLALCLLGALKFASLDRASAGQQPKAIAFWGAATILQLLAGKAAHPTTEWAWVDLSKPAASPTSQSEPAPTPKIENKHVGDQVSGGTVNKATFYGPVTGPVHTGSGNINASGSAPAPSSSEPKKN